MHKQLLDSCTSFIFSFYEINISTFLAMLNCGMSDYEVGIIDEVKAKLYFSVLNAGIAEMEQA